MWQRILPARRVGWLWLALSAGIAVNTLRLRRRLSGLRALDPSARAAAGATDDFIVVHPPAVTVDADTRAAAVAHALVEGLDVVDLVPGDLPRDQALDLARTVDTRSYRRSPLAPGRGAVHALLVRRGVFDQAGAGGVSSNGAAPIPARAAGVTSTGEVVIPAGAGGVTTNGVVVVPDRGALVRLTQRLKQHAAQATDLIVAPHLGAVDPSPPDRLGQLEALYGPAAPMAVGFPTARWAMLLTGLVVSPGWAAVATVECLLQPYLVTAGVSPHLHPRRRTRGEPFALLRAALATKAPPGEDPIEERRPAYAAELAQGTARFFEPRRTTCPWCDSPALVQRLHTPDLTQFKPGRFVIDECTGCGLLFQNPRLTIEGLDFYYRDCYDGLGMGETEFLFSQATSSYRGRVALARRHTTPRRWLDVGTGYGHFCAVARDLLPDTCMDGLDMGASVEEAQRRGWIDQAYRGMFPDLAPSLQGIYDMVSMHHYLEHTRDPWVELAAARTVLGSGGYLLIEVPDPECRFARLLGRYWLPWLQPQHQQFLQVSHVTAALSAQGFTVVEVERGAARQPVDLGGAAWMLASSLAPPGRLPWRDPPTAGDRVKRAAIFGATVPVALLGLVADRALQPVIRTRAQRWSNAYRVLARRD